MFESINLKNQTDNLRSRTRNKKIFLINVEEEEVKLEVGWLTININKQQLS